MWTTKMWRAEQGRGQNSGGKSIWGCDGQTIPRNPVTTVTLESEGNFSIRLPEATGRVECAQCQEVFRAAGPTGHDGDRPICDLCLLRGARELGILLGLASVTRTFANLEFPSIEEYRLALEEVAHFARAYERVARRSGPPRPFHVPQGILRWGARDWRVEDGRTDA